MIEERDPWDWTAKQHTPPLSNTLQVQPAQEAAPIQHIQGEPDPISSMVSGKLLNKGADMAEKQISTIWGSTTPAVETAATSAAGETLAGAPLGSAAAAGTEGMLSALGPIGWGIGGILLARKLGLFR